RALLRSSLVVGFNDLRSRPDHLHRASLQQQAASAQLGNLAEVVGDEDDGGATRDHGIHAFDTLALEEIVANAEHLIHKQNIRIDVGGNRKPEAGIHARRVPLDRCIDEFLAPGESNNGIKAPTDLVSRHAQNRAIEVDVLATSKVWVKARTDLDESGDTTCHAD